MRLNVLLALLPMVLAAPAQRSEPARLIKTAETSRLIANKYIVKFNDASALGALDSAMSILSEAPEQVYENAFRGFAATLDAETLERLRNHPDVDYIEQDAIITVERAYTSQPGAPWGLNRISSRSNGASSYGMYTHKQCMKL